MRSLNWVVFAMALTASALPADVTIRFHSDSKLVPAALADRTIRIKGNRASFAIGNLTALVDFTRQELTVQDSARKTLATIPVSQYHDRIKAAMPEMQAVMAQMFDPAKVRIASIATRRTATIQGMAAEERELTITVPVVIPGGDASSKAEMKLAMRIWIVTAAEFRSKPALGELAAFGQ
jgi:hypothetical protein